MSASRRRLTLPATLVVTMLGCSNQRTEVDAGPPEGMSPGSSVDAALADADPDPGTPDAAPPDAGPVDAAPPDAMVAIDASAPPPDAMVPPDAAT